MLKTLIYADIFDYPLTEAEIKRWQIESDHAGFKSLKGLDPVVKTGNYYHLRGRSSLVSLRQRRYLASQKKWPFVHRVAKILSFIPWIKLVCVTGALAMNNGDTDDDIDLMIVTTQNRLWLTRILASFLFLPWLRRRPLCFNLWLDETSLAIKQRNLYIAHEICQAKPVFDRDNTYQEFIMANLWYKKYLPNWTI